MASPAKGSDTVGDLTAIPLCSLYIPTAKDSQEGGVIQFYSMPTITDSKGAKYDPAPVIGRATPIMTYSSSEIRQISLDIPFIACKTSDFARNAKYLRWIASAAYPQKGKNGCPYIPPPICVIKFGSFLWADGNTGICVSLDKYNVKNDPTVPSDPATLIPVKFTVSTSWQVVYASDELPNSELIVQLGK